MEDEIKEILERSKSFVDFVAYCIKLNGEYSPLSSQEYRELSKDLKNIIDKINKGD